MQNFDPDLLKMFFFGFNHLLLAEMRLNQFPPNPLLSGDGVHGEAGSSGALHVLRVGKAKKDFADAFLRQTGD